MTSHPLDGLPRWTYAHAAALLRQAGVARRRAGERVPREVEALERALLAMAGGPRADPCGHTRTSLDAPCHRPQPDLSGDRLLTPDETAAALNISTRHVRRLVQAGDLPATSLGRSTRHRTTHLRDLIDRHTTTADAAGITHQEP